MIATVELPLRLQQQMHEEALRAFPRECCGLVEGTTEILTLSLIPAKAEKGARVTALHPMQNVAADVDRFEIDPAQHISLLRKLRGTDRKIIGCYHSHPNGRAEPSARDRESAAGSGFLWLIVAVNPDSFERIQLGAFVGDGHTLSEVEVVGALPGTAGLRPAAGGTPALPGSLDRSAAPLL